MRGLSTSMIALLLAGALAAADSADDNAIVTLGIEKAVQCTFVQGNGEMDPLTGDLVLKTPGGDGFWSSVNKTVIQAGEQYHLPFNYTANGWLLVQSNATCTVRMPTQVALTRDPPMSGAKTYNVTATSGPGYVYPSGSGVTWMYDYTPGMLYLVGTFSSGRRWVRIDYSRVQEWNYSDLAGHYEGTHVITITPVH